MNAVAAESIARQRGSAFEVLRIFIRLGLTSFGGPVAHLHISGPAGRTPPLARRGGLRRHCGALPVSARAGQQPNRDQPGHAARRPAGRLRRLAPRPSAAARPLHAGVTAFEIFRMPRGCTGSRSSPSRSSPMRSGGMARNLCPDRPRATIAVGAAVLALAVPSSAGQVGAIAAGGLLPAAANSSALVGPRRRRRRRWRFACRAPCGSPPGSPLSPS